MFELKFESEFIQPDWSAFQTLFVRLSLLRLRIVELGHAFLREGDKKDIFAMFSSPEYKGETISISARDEFLEMTSLGQSFVVACINDESTK